MTETSARRYDVAIIGAGVNGAGIARDAALRGLTTLVVEQDDACSGCSWASSRLIHGGLRYLEYGEIPLVRESLRERRILRSIAGHLVKPLRICIPVYRSGRRGAGLIRLGMIAYDLLSWSKNLPRHRMWSRERILMREPGLRADELRAAACYYDAQVAYAERLVVENLLAARLAGADVRTHTRVADIGIRDRRVESLVCEDRLTGQVERVAVQSVVNAGGPWVDEVLERAGFERPDYVGGTKGSHIVVGRWDGAPQDAYYVEAQADGRPIFIIPWNDMVLIGTTDIRYDGELDAVRASRPEVDYLLAETNRVFPGANLDATDIHYGYAGVRPLPQRTEGPESAITRKHIIESHAGIARGLVSIIGGKLTTYRNLAEETVDHLARVLDRRLPDSATAYTPLPGAVGIDAARQALAGFAPISAAGRKRLLRIYGGRAAGIVELAAMRPELAHCIDDQRLVSAAEIAFTTSEEFPRTLVDIIQRRTMLGLDADQGRPCYEAVGRVAAGELGWSSERLGMELDGLRQFVDSLLIA